MEKKLMEGVMKSFLENYEVRGQENFSVMVLWDKNILRKI